MQHQKCVIFPKISCQANVSKNTQTVEGMLCYSSKVFTLFLFSWQLCIYMSINLLPEANHFPILCGNCSSDLFAKSSKVTERIFLTDILKCKVVGKC